MGHSEYSSSVSHGSTMGHTEFPSLGTHQLVSAVPTQHLLDEQAFVCGAGAAFINIMVTFPINKVMFRQMVHDIPTVHAINQLKREGLSKLYRGVLPPLCQKTCSTSIMFGMYYKYMHMIYDVSPEISHGTANFLAGNLAGCTEALLCPFERVQSVLQDKKFYGHYKNTLHVASELRKFGICEYYRGLIPILLRNGPGNVMFFGFREPLREYLPSMGNTWWSDVVKDFVSGSLLGAVISTTFYPINVIKTHQQCQVGGEFISLWKTFFTVYHERGGRLLYLYRGAHVNFTRALVSWGIINASYELLRKHFYHKS
ncbi:unnamed protein product [Meganyctiphanes norvegica]|uniref:Solute carrier family 25 member 51 n=1 Tax=Meganyctiphanes norvegica TaxID=48144 RepID=A0AAV2RU41_MEGNR